MSPPPPTADNAFIEFTRRLGILASGDFSVDPASFQRIVTENIQGTPIDTQTRINDIFLENVRAYLFNTNQSILFNDVTNANEYLRDTLSKEIDRYATVRDRTFNSIHKTRHSYMSKKYATHYYQFMSVLAQFTIFTILLIGLAFYAYKHEGLEWLSLQGAIYASLGIAAVYLIVVVMFYKQNQLRRRDDWNKFYFPTKESSTKSCS